MKLIRPGQMVKLKKEPIKEGKETPKTPGNSKRGKLVNILERKIHRDEHKKDAKE